MNLSGHLWTIAGGMVVRSRRIAVLDAAAPWSGSVDDPDIGAVRLSGRLHGAGRERMIVILHGLGGSAESYYSLEAAAACVDAGCSALRLNLRGADNSGEDYYHAGLTADLRAALTSPELAAAESIGVLGVSLGGHQTLLAATDSGLDPRVRAVAAISAPLDLDSCCRQLDAPTRWPYRRYMLGRLCDVYAAVAARRPVPASVERVRKVRRFRDFDRLVIAPRFGFTSAEDYYARASVGPRLSELVVPGLYVGSLDDPMVPRSAVEPWLDRLPSAVPLDVHWARRGGHVALSRLLAARVVAWLRHRLDR